MSEKWLAEVRSSYDIDAPGYAEQISGLLDQRPLLRGSLATFAELLKESGSGPVADIGCGPGYVTRFLSRLGLDAFGIDLSPEMIKIAQRSYPDLRFEVGTMTALDLDDHSVAGIVAFWSLIHIPDDAVPGVFAEFRRVVRPGGPVLVGFHVGDEKRRRTVSYTGESVGVDSYRRSPGAVSGWLRKAGFTIDAELIMGPDDDVPGAIIIAHV